MYTVTQYADNGARFVGSRRYRFKWVAYFQAWLYSGHGSAVAGTYGQFYVTTVVKDD